MFLEFQVRLSLWDWAGKVSGIIPYEIYECCSAWLFYDNLASFNPHNDPFSLCRCVSPPGNKGEMFVGLMGKRSLGGGNANEGKGTLKETYYAHFQVYHFILGFF